MRSDHREKVEKFGFETRCNDYSIDHGHNFSISKTPQQIGC